MRLTLLDRLSRVGSGERLCSLSGSNAIFVFDRPVHFGGMQMYVRRFFNVVPAVLFTVACGGETPPAESPEGADQDAMAEESDMGDDMMGDEMTGEESMGDEETAEGDGGEEDAME
jgi:hypothetical protein